MFHIKNLIIHLYPFQDFNHYTIITKGKALTILGFIKRNAKIFNSAVCLRTLYRVPVYCILEYEVIVWHLYSTKDKLWLECGQNKFLSHVAFIFNTDNPRHAEHVKYTNTFLSPPWPYNPLLNGPLGAPCLLIHVSFHVQFYFYLGRTPINIPTHFTPYLHNYPWHRILHCTNSVIIVPKYCPFNVFM